MSLAVSALAGLGLLTVAPLTVWAERKVKAWTQLRRGPPLVQPYRDLRRLWRKAPLAPDTASGFYFVEPALGLACVLLAALALPLAGATAVLGGPAALVAFGLLFTLQRALVAAQAYDTGTPFGGLGASRELFLGGLGEPVLFLIAAAVFLATGAAAVPLAPLDASAPSTWLVLGALGMLWAAESARIPFDNPATHLELTMVHEALVLESSGWMLAAQELTTAFKQALFAALLLLLVVPLPTSGPARLALIAAGVIALSGLLALLESTLAKVRLFRASHLLVMAALLAFLGGAVAFLEAGGS